MILWDKVTGNLHNAQDMIRRWVGIVAERTRIEADVARLLVEKGKRERDIERAFKKIGERAFLSIDAAGEINLADPVLLGAVEDVREGKREIARLSASIRDITHPGSPEEAYFRESSS